MSEIKILNIPVGKTLFQDSESFLNELDDSEIGAIAGGIMLVPTHTIDLHQYTISVHTKIKTVITQSASIHTAGWLSKSTIGHWG